MQVPLQITMRNVEHSEAVEDKIRTKADKLNKFSEDIISCQIVVEQNQGHQKNGVLHNVRILVTMPQKKELVINKNETENLYLAIREAFDDMARKVEEASRMMHGDVKHHSPIIHGEIARLFDEDEFGFIQTSSGDEYYFNVDSLTKHAWSQLKVGMPVHFIEKMGQEGMRACRVSLSKEH